MPTDPKPCGETIAFSMASELAQPFLESYPGIVDYAPTRKPSSKPLTPYPNGPLRMQVPIRRHAGHGSTGSTAQPNSRMQGATASSSATAQNTQTTAHSNPRSRKLWFQGWTYRKQLKDPSQNISNMARDYVVFYVLSTGREPECVILPDQGRRTDSRFFEDIHTAYDSIYKSWNPFICLTRLKFVKVSSTRPPSIFLFLLTVVFRSWKDITLTYIPAKKNCLAGVIASTSTSPRMLRLHQYQKK
jgi:hypothetical protein